MDIAIAVYIVVYLALWSFLVYAAVRLLKEL